MGNGPYPVDYPTRYCPCGAPIPKLNKHGRRIGPSAYRARIYCRAAHQRMRSDTTIMPSRKFPDPAVPTPKSDHPLMLTRDYDKDGRESGYRIIHVPTKRLLIGSLTNYEARAMIEALSHDGTVNWHFARVSELTKTKKRAIRSAIMAAGPDRLRRSMDHQ